MLGGMGRITVTLYFISYIAVTSIVIFNSECNFTSVRNEVRTMGVEMMRNEAWKYAERQIARKILYSAWPLQTYGPPWLCCRD